MQVRFTPTFGGVCLTQPMGKNGPRWRKILLLHFTEKLHDSCLSYEFIYLKTDPPFSISELWIIVKVRGSVLPHFPLVGWFLSKLYFWAVGHLGCVHAYFASAFWNADSKRRSKTPLIQAIVRAQVNRKGVYMTSFKRGYNVILRSCFHQNQRFALTTIVNAHFWAAFMLILRRRFETLIQNADPKRRSRKYCSCFPREEDDTFTEEGMSRNSRNV